MNGEIPDPDAYFNRGIAYGEKDQSDQAVDDFTKVLEIEPKAAGAYYYRATTYYSRKDYNNSWKDIKKAQDLGYKISSDFLDDLRKASGRQN